MREGWSRWVHLSAVRSWDTWNVLDRLIFFVGPPVLHVLRLLELPCDSSSLVVSLEFPFISP